MARYWISLLAVCPAALAQPASFQGIGHLPGQQISTAAAVSADGTVVVGSAQAAANTVAIRWTAPTGLQILEPEPGFGAPSWNWSANAVSTDGAVIVGSADAGMGGWLGADFAFRWTAATGMVNLGHLPGGTHSGAFGVSGDGSIVVGFSRPVGPWGTASFRWTAAGGMQEFISSDLNRAHAISNDGAAIIGAHFAHSYYWTAASGMQLVGQKVENFAAGISGDGTFVVGSQDSLGYPYRWSPGGPVQSLGSLPGAWFSGAMAVSDDGAIVVGWSFDDFGNDAFVWDEVHGIRLLRDVLVSTYGLNVTGWELWRADSISADGTVIVGTGRNPAGHQEGWIARLGSPVCYANCDGSTVEPILNVEDFICFVSEFAQAQSLPHAQQVIHYANCDGSTAVPALNVEDFTCFTSRFAAGCP